MRLLLALLLLLSFTLNVSAIAHAAAGDTHHGPAAAHDHDGGGDPGEPHLHDCHHGCASGHVMDRPQGTASPLPADWAAPPSPRADADAFASASRAPPARPPRILT